MTNQQPITVKKLAQIAANWPPANADGKEPVVLLGSPYPEIPVGLEAAVTLDSTSSGQNLIIAPAQKPIPSDFSGGAAGVLRLAKNALQYWRIGPDHHDPDFMAALMLRAITAIDGYERMEAMYASVDLASEQTGIQEAAPSGLPSEPEILLSELEQLASQACTVALELGRLIRASSGPPTASLNQLDQITSNLESAAEFTRNHLPQSQS